jgi:hypothetical protein
MCGKNMVAMSGTSQSGAGSNYPLGFQGGALICMWKDETNPSCFAATFGCFVTIFYCYKMLCLCNKKKKNKDNPTLKGTKVIPEHFSCKSRGNFCTPGSFKDNTKPL